MASGSSLRLFAAAGWLTSIVLSFALAAHRSDLIALRAHLETLQSQRRLAEHATARHPLSDPLLQKALGMDAELLHRVGEDLLRRLRKQEIRWERVGTGPLKVHYGNLEGRSIVQDAFVRLYHVLFELRLLPIQAWGGREFNTESPLPKRLSDATKVGRRQTGNLARLAINLLLLNHSWRVPANATCLEIDVTTYVLTFEGCTRANAWSLKYEPDYSAAPRPPRVNRQKQWLHMDLMSITSPTMAGDANAMFDCMVLQETFEHVRYPHLAVQGIYHLLKPGGIVLWTAPFSAIFHLIPGDYFRYTFDGARQLFLSAGFEIVALHKFGDSHLSMGNNLGMGTGDFTVEHIQEKLLQTIYIDGRGAEDGQAKWAEGVAENLYMASAVVARRPMHEPKQGHDERGAGRPLSMTPWLDSKTPYLRSHAALSKHGSGR